MTSRFFLELVHKTRGAVLSQLLPFPSLSYEDKTYNIKMILARFHGSSESYLVPRLINEFKNTLD